QVCVVAENHHQSPFRIRQSTEMRLLRVRSLPGDAGVLAFYSERRVGYLRLLFDIVVIVEDWMLDRQLHRFLLGKYFLKLLRHLGPFPFSPEIVQHQKTSTQQIFPERGSLLRAE